MKRFAAICLFAASTALVGCGSSEPSNVMDSADQSAVEAYEAAIAAKNAAMESDSADSEIP